MSFTDLGIFKDKIPSYGHIQYETTFHEVSHLIDHFIGGSVEISTTFKNGIFGKTIREEIQMHINAKKEQLKKDAIAKGQSPKSIKIKDVYDAISKDLMSLNVNEGVCVSDIFSGGTLNKTKGHAKHPTKYWLESEQHLTHEAFAHMFNSTMINSQSLKQLRKYFPKSHKIFEEMIDSFLKKKGAF